MMAYDMEGCRRMAAAAHKHGKLLEVGYNRFYDPNYQAAYEHVIRPGLLGEVYHVRLMYHRNRSWRRDTKPPSADYSPARWGYPTWDHLCNWRLYRKYSQGLVAELGGHQISTTSLFLGASPTAALGSGGIYRFKDREVNDHVFVTLEYPQGRTVTFSSIESNDFDHITEQFMGTRGTLIIGREGEVLLFGGGDEGKKIESEARPTGIEVTPRTSGAVMEASPLSVGGRDVLRGDPRRRPPALRGGHGPQDHGRLPGRQRGHGQEGTRRDPYRLSRDHSPETAPAVSASSASIAAPGSLPSVAAFLYGLAGPRRSLPRARSTKPTSASVAGKKFPGYPE
ncbi:MAG: hypothetical protein DMF77_17315 [Acidobacteria bacterium]|nr:MAG: hypothetical protein DMF77_17315 [Acidobacteriota bacterium]